MLLDDYLLRRLALLFSVIGLISIFFISQLNEPKEIKISEITGKQISEKISTTGIVSWSRFSKGALIFELQDSGKIPCVIFSPTVEHFSLVKKGKAVKVEGKLQLYKNSPEIIVEKVFSIEPG